MGKTKQERCEGQRRGFRRGTYGTFRCTKRATGTVVTQVGHSVSHPCCGEQYCIAVFEKHGIDVNQGESRS